MATTTPNYGWVVPTSTDLVKDGATAIETLGDSVDATVKALNPETTLGDISYRSATANTNTRLAIGSSGQVLSVSGGVPAWTTAAGGDFTKITSSTFTTSSSVSINNCFTSTYKNYRILFTVTAATAGNNQRLRFRASSTDNTTANYNGQNQYFGASSGIFTTASGTSVYLYDSATNGNALVLDILSPQVADKSWYTMAAMQGSNYSVFGAGFFAGSDQFDGISLYPASGTITGSIAIYGYGA